MAVKSIGFISELIGSAQIRTAEGRIKLALQGDIVKEGEVVLTGQFSSVVIDFNSGEQLKLGAQAQVALDDTVSFEEGANLDLTRVEFVGNTDGLVSAACSLTLTVRS